MKLVILTGMSGAGKSTALKMMEDIGFYCVDNLPIPLIEKFAELSETSKEELQKFAIGIDIRSGNSFSELEEVLNRLDESGQAPEILFLDAEDAVLVQQRVLLLLEDDLPLVDQHHVVGDLLDV